MASPPNAVIRNGLVGHHLKRAMVVTVVAMRMVQVPIDQVVDVVSVRHGLVATARTVPMPLIVTATSMVWRTAIGVSRADLDDVLVDVVLMRMVEVSVVQIVDVALMPHSDMTAIWPMDVRVIGMDGMTVGGHGESPFYGDVIKRAFRPANPHTGNRRNRPTSQLQTPLQY